MQTTSKLYQSLLHDANTIVETKAEIAGVEYGGDKLISCSTDFKMFSGNTVCVGSCCSAEVDLSILEPGDIPRMAQIDLYRRLNNGTEVSEWLPAGVFYVDTRSIEEDVLTLHGFDAMLKAEQTFLLADDVGEWPRSCVVVVNEICARMGVTLDDRTVLNPSYMVDYPNDYTMRELLGYIAGAHAGNWIMTPAGKLRLITLAETPPETTLLMDDYGDTICFGEVRIIV